MTETEINRQITLELLTAFQKLGGPPFRLQQIPLEAKSSDRVVAEFAKFHAPFDLLCIIGSWGDTLLPEQLVHGLRMYNRNGITFSRIMCAGEPDYKPDGTA